MSIRYILTKHAKNRILNRKISIYDLKKCLKQLPRGARPTDKNIYLDDYQPCLNINNETDIYKYEYNDMVAIVSITEKTLITVYKKDKYIFNYTNHYPSIDNIELFNPRESKKATRMIEPNKYDIIEQQFNINSQRKKNKSSKQKINKDQILDDKKISKMKYNKNIAKSTRVTRNNYYD